MNYPQKKIKISCSNIRKDKSNDSELETQCIFGDEIVIKFTEKNWSFCRLASDGYEGWISNNDFYLTHETNYVVSILKTFAYQKPNFKSGVLLDLYLNSKVKVVNFLDGWAQIYLCEKQFAFVPCTHIRKKNKIKKDWLKTALMFQNLPYLWGGKSSAGIDCSGLVQLSLEFSGHAFPRNSKDQVNYSNDLYTDTDIIEKGCLIFWKGHVAIALSDRLMIHSNSHHMSVVVENINEAKKRISKTDGDIICIKKVNI